jgi:hypothetical protein
MPGQLAWAAPRPPERGSPFRDLRLSQFPAPPPWVRREPGCALAGVLVIHVVLGRLQLVTRKLVLRYRTWVSFLPIVPGCPEWQEVKPGPKRYAGRNGNRAPPARPHENHAPRCPEPAGPDPEPAGLRKDNALRRHKPPDLNPRAAAARYRGEPLHDRRRHHAEPDGAKGRDADERLHDRPAADPDVPGTQAATHNELPVQTEPADHGRRDRSRGRQPARRQFRDAPWHLAGLAGRDVYPAGCGHRPATLARPGNCTASGSGSDPAGVPELDCSVRCRSRPGWLQQEGDQRSRQCSRYHPACRPARERHADATSAASGRSRCSSSTAPQPEPPGRGLRSCVRLTALVLRG